MTAQSPEYRPPIMISPSRRLPQLPAELLLLIASFLPNRDLKSLRLASKLLGETPLSFPRVFLSANSLDIKFFRSIANHPVFRYQVTEIIWDDARFVSAPKSWEDYEPYINPRDLKIEDGCPRWFLKECQENISNLKLRKSCDVDRPDHIARQQQVNAQMPLKDCWEHYLRVLNDQQAVIESQDDEKAFLYGLERFPKLTRVTVTPAAHGRIFSPLYQTPTIRAFTYGFNYPIPRGWHIHPSEGAITEPLPWSEAKEEYKELWRGARIVLRALASSTHAIEGHNVSELCFDSSELATGINYMISAQPCEEYNHFAAIMKRPGFRHLHLSLLVGNSWVWGGHEGFTSGYFYKAISLAKELTHFHLTTALTGGSAGEPAVPLKEMIPIQQWPNLYHFGLTKLSINTSDLIDLLKLAPPSLQSVELGSLHSPNDGGLWSGLLERVRDELDWTKRDQSLRVRPALKITMEMEDSHAGRLAVLTDEVTNFLYHSGEIPTGSTRNFPKLGMGTLHDIYEPEYTRPHVMIQELKELGISKGF